MHWVAPIEKDAVDQSRANSSPIPGWIFLRFAEVRVMLRGDNLA